jgi:hypothetical protein
MSEIRRFHPDVILRALIAHDVHFIIVGGLAAQAHGSPTLTSDLDICYARDAENVARLVATLGELAAVRRGLPADTPKLPPLDARTLHAGGLFTLTTSAGDFDIVANPDPNFDYELLLTTAESTHVDGQRALVASLDALIAMKRAAGRPKDRIELEILGALREELDRRDPRPNRS